MSRELPRLLVSAFFLLFTLASQPLGQEPTFEGLPALIPYGGRVAVDDVQHDGPGFMKFSFVDGAGTTTHWSNDGAGVGGGEPQAAVPINFVDGRYSAVLGDITLTNMTVIDPALLPPTDLYLRVWFSADNVTFDRLDPDTRVLPAFSAWWAGFANSAGNAATADSALSADSAGTATSATTAANANLLDGQDSTAFFDKLTGDVDGNGIIDQAVAATTATSASTAGDSDLLDGMDSTEFFDKITSDVDDNGIIDQADSAAQADFATAAQHATSADSAESALSANTATTATSATTASNAELLDGLDSTVFFDKANDDLDGNGIIDQADAATMATSAASAADAELLDGLYSTEFFDKTTNDVGGNGIIDQADFAHASTPPSLEEMPSGTVVAADSPADADLISKGYSLMGAFGEAPTWTAGSDSNAPSPRSFSAGVWSAVPSSFGEARLARRSIPASVAVMIHQPLSGLFSPPS